MVKVQGPVFSTDARGSIAGAITYKKNNNVNYVSSIRGGIIASTPAVVNRRNTFKNAVFVWTHFKPNQKEIWRTWASVNKPNWTGYNAFLHYWLDAVYSGLEPSYLPPS